MADQRTLPSSLTSRALGRGLSPVTKLIAFGPLEHRWGRRGFPDYHIQYTSIVNPRNWRPKGRRLVIQWSMRRQLTSDITAGKTTNGAKHGDNKMISQTIMRASPKHVSLGDSSKYSTSKLPPSATKSPSDRVSSALPNATRTRNRPLSFIEDMAKMKSRGCQDFQFGQRLFHCHRVK
jgi:hypothetical protein